MNIGLGDRVRIVRNLLEGSSNLYIGKFGIVSDISHDDPLSYIVDLEPQAFAVAFLPDELEVIDHEDR